MNVSTVPTTPNRSRSCTPALDESTDPESTFSDAKISSEDSDTEFIPAKPVRNLCFVGAGYVGGPTAAVIAHQNPSINVTVVDKDQSRIRRWNSRHLPIYEPGLANIVRVARDGLKESSTEDEQKQIGDGPAVSAREPNLFFSSDVSKCISESDIVLIAVNTPTKTRGSGQGRATDMTSFEAVTAEVVRHAKEGTIIVEKSTVPCRTAEMIQEMVGFSTSLQHSCQLTLYYRFAFKDLGSILRFCQTPNFWPLELLCRTLSTPIVLSLAPLRPPRDDAPVKLWPMCMPLGLIGLGFLRQTCGPQNWQNLLQTQCLPNA